MRISAIIPVGSPTAAPVDAVHWNESSRRVRPVEACAAEKVRTFQEVMDHLADKPYHKRTRVMEVVSARGIRSGHVRLAHEYHDSNQ